MDTNYQPQSVPVIPDIIIKHISLSFYSALVLVLRYTLDFSISAGALSTEAQIEE